MIEQDKPKYPRRKPVRLKDFDYATSGEVFSLTLCSRGKQHVFTDKAFNMEVIECIKVGRKRVGHVVYVYFMPDHLHLLSSPLESGVSITQFIGGLSSKITRLSWKYGFSGKLLQRSFYDHVLRKDEDLKEKEIVKYILNNPVRKGLTENWEDYPFCAILDSLPL